jgi:N utilization substance protein B
VSRRQARELAFKVLFQLDQVGGDPHLVLARLLAGKVRSPEVVDYAAALIGGVSAHQEQIDATLRQHSKNWKIERMFSIDRVILRMGIYEIMLEADMPAAIVIDEAIELGKRYGEESSPAFINAMLDQVRLAQNQLAQEV